MKFKVLSVFFLIFTFSCNQNDFSDEEGLIQFLKKPENGYTLAKTVNEVEFSILYKPTDLLVTQELLEKESKVKVDSLRKKYGNYLYFNLSISKDNKEVLNAFPNNREDYGEMVNQLSYYMKEKIHFYTSSKDTIEMADYIYPRLYGISKKTSILLVYPFSEKLFNSDSFVITLEDIGLHTGEVRFEFQTKKIKNEPSIIFK